MRIDLDEIETGALLALVGLAVSVMQNDEENGRGFIAALSQPPMEAICKALVEKLNTEARDVQLD